MFEQINIGRQFTHRYLASNQGSKEFRFRARWALWELQETCKITCFFMILQNLSKFKGLYIARQPDNKLIL